MSPASSGLLFFFASAVLLQGAGLPAKPLDGFLDDAIVFNAEQAAQIKAQTRETLQRDGVALYVTTMTFISGSNVRERSTALMRAWTQEAPGLVLAYNRGEGQPALSLSPGFWRRYPSDEVAQLLQSCVPILSREATPPDTKLMEAVSHITSSIQTMEAGRVARSTVFRPQDQRVAIMLAGALVALGVLAWLVSLRVKRKGAARRQRHYLPEVEVGLRLGAPHGGGTMAEVSARDQG